MREEQRPRDTELHRPYELGLQVSMAMHGYQLEIVTLL